MKKILLTIFGIGAIGFVIYSGSQRPLEVLAGTPALTTFQGGTGTTSPSGILSGDNGATGHLNTTILGPGLFFSAGTLSLNTGAFDAFTHPSAGVSATTSSIQAPIIDKGGQVYNVKAYGAKGDGTTDDTAAIQACIDALPTNGGECFFPIGQYEISNTIVIKKHGVSLNGVPFASTFADQVNQQSNLIGTSVIIASSTLGFPAGKTIIQAGELGTSKMWTGGGVYDLVLVGIKNHGVAGNGIDVFNIQAFRVMNNGITLTAKGVNVSSDQSGGISNVIVEHNILYGLEGIGIFMGPGSNENYVRFNYISNAVGYGIYTGASGNTLVNNHIEGTSASSTLSKGGTGIYLSSGRSFVYENDIYTSQTFGIYAGASNIQVVGNHINDVNTTDVSNGSGIYVSGTIHDVEVVANGINDNDGHMIYGIYDNSNGAGVLIESNIITGQSLQKIYTANSNLAPDLFLGQVGIGTTTPSYDLSIANASTTNAGYVSVSNIFPGDIFAILNNGSVGVGTSSPTSSFSVLGGSKLYSININAIQSVALNSTTSIPDLDQTITLAAYAYPNDAATRTVVSLQTDDTSSSKLSLVYDGPNQRFTVLKGGGSTVVATTTHPQSSLNTWYEVAYTYDGSVNSLYVNGVLQATSSTSHNTGSPNKVYIGRTGSGTIWLGNIDNARIWNTALTANQISLMYNSYSSTPRSNLVGEWLFDEGSGIIVLDTSGTGNTGALNGPSYSNNISGEIPPTSIIADFTALNDATSSLRIYSSGQVDGGFFNATMSTSTFKGINLNSGCFAINSVCLTQGSGTVSSGLAGQLAWYSANGTTIVGSSTGQLTVGSLLATSTTATSTIGLALGIGTSTPWAALSISTSTNGAPAFVVGNPNFTSLIVDQNGLVGIGTSAPSTSGLNVQASSKTALRIDNTQSSRYLDAFTGASERFGITYTAAGNLELQSFTSTKLVINDQGNNVSIGTANNGSPLTINGATSIGSSFNTLAAPTNGLIVVGSTGIGTSSPMAKLSITDNPGVQTPLFNVSTSTPTATTTAFIIAANGNIGIGATSTPYSNLSVQSGLGTGNAFTVATSSGAQIGGMDNDGHRFSSGPAPAVSSCGTGTGTVVGDDQSGTVTTATAATACTVTFSKAYRNTPTCIVTDNSLVGFADVASISTTAVTFGISSALTGGNLFYNCSYHQ